MVKARNFILAAALFSFFFIGESCFAGANVMIKLTFNSEEIIIKMRNNPTSRDFLSLLPLTLTFEDYASAEKISYLSRKLSLEGAPTGSDPAPGDFTLYAPWGNIAIFYEDRGYANGLLILGSVESGVEKLVNVNGNFSAIIEKIE